MTSPETGQQLALQDEIARLVAKASTDRVVIRVATEANRLARQYSVSGLSSHDIAKIIVDLATPSGVALELGGLAFRG
jgi:hypothetical protein